MSARSGNPSLASDESDPPLFENGEIIGRRISPFDMQLSDEEIPLTSPIDHVDKVADFKQKVGRKFYLKSKLFSIII